MSKTKAKKGTDLEVRKAATQLATEVGIIKKKPKIITKQLQKKEDPTLRDKMWVNNDIVLLGFGITGTLSSIPLTIALGGLSQWFFLGAGVIGLILTIVAAVIISNREDDRDKFNKYMNHGKRKLLVMGEKSRVNASHAAKRKGRIIDTEFDYAQYSVDVQYGRKAITLSVMKHIPWKEGRYKTELLELTEEHAKALFPERYKKYEQMVQKDHEKWEKKQARDKESGYRDAYDHYVKPEFNFNSAAKIQLEKEKHESIEEFHERVLDAQTKLEHIAEVLEEEAYNERKEELEIKRIALTTKRA